MFIILLLFEMKYFYDHNSFCSVLFMTCVVTIQVGKVTQRWVVKLLATSSALLGSYSSYYLQVG